MCFSRAPLFRRRRNCGRCGWDKYNHVNNTSDALYHPLGPHDSMEQKIGRMIYEEFTTVVILKEQLRVTDQGWRSFLTHLRYGRVEQADIDMLSTLVLGKGEDPDFRRHPGTRCRL